MNQSHSEGLLLSISILLFIFLIYYSSFLLSLYDECRCDSDKSEAWSLFLNVLVPKLDSYFLF